MPESPGQSRATYRSYARFCCLSIVESSKLLRFNSFRALNARPSILNVPQWVRWQERIERWLWAIATSSPQKLLRVQVNSGLRQCFAAGQHCLHERPSVNYVSYVSPLNNQLQARCRMDNFTEVFHLDIYNGHELG